MEAWFREGTQCCHPHPLGPPRRFPATFMDSILVSYYLKFLCLAAGDFSLAWERQGSEPIRDKSW